MNRKPDGGSGIPLQPDCECGHPERKHYDDANASHCLHFFGFKKGWCQCPKYRPVKRELPQNDRTSEDAVSH